MLKLCVFCGSRTGRSNRHGELARQLGRSMAERGLGLVYGGGRIGLMGELADASLSRGGRVIGVIPGFLMEQEVGHGSLERLEVVDDMLMRKQRMIELSDAFLTLPGGLGSLDELFEVLTWRQLGLHHKPLLLLDPEAYYQPLLEWLDRAVTEGFMDPAHRDVLERYDDVEQALDRVEAGP